MNAALFPALETLLAVARTGSVAGAARQRHITSSAVSQQIRRLEAYFGLKFFERAVAKYPKNVPLNVILMPMEGDPSAPSAFWLASRRTGGSFISPSKDWP